MSERLAKAYEYLSQKLSRREPQLSVYALNKHAKALAYLSFLEQINENMNLFEILKIFFREVGSAKAVMNLDPLSQLGLRAGGSRIVISFADQHRGRGKKDSK